MHQSRVQYSGFPDGKQKLVLGLKKSISAAKSHLLRPKRLTVTYKKKEIPIWIHSGICDATLVEALSNIQVALFKNPMCKLDKVALGVKTTGGPITAKPQF